MRNRSALALRRIGGFGRLDGIEHRNPSLGPGKLEVQRRWLGCRRTVKRNQELPRTTRHGSVPDNPLRVQGKFFFVGDEKFYVRGVTYGTFRPNQQGDEFPPLKTVHRDFARMAATGVNTVRTYTPPPLWLLDAAQRHGLRIMAGLPVERSVAFLDYRKCARSIEEMVRAEVRARAGHPAILGYTIGNEIPASIVRWHGRRKLERFLERLYCAAKEEDPDGLVTYVNYPSTEYLQLSFLDFACFNVYLESQNCLDAYLARLHNIAGDRPLVMAEVGLDSLRNGEAVQAQVLDWQIRTSFAAGCAGAFVYAWTTNGFAAVRKWRTGSSVSPIRTGERSRR